MNHPTCIHTEDDKGGDNEAKDTAATQPGAPETDHASQTTGKADQQKGTGKTNGTM